MGWMLGLAFAGSAFGTQKAAEPVEETTRVASPSERATEQLRRLAELHPDHAALVSYGVSAGGRELLALQVTVRPGEAGGPLLAVVADLSHGDWIEQQWVALETELRALVLGGADAADAAPPLQDRLWILSPDPDRLDGAESPGRAWPEGDFPAGWDPWCTAVRTGPYPYSTPEAAALGRYLGGQSALAGMVLVGPESGRKAAGWDAEGPGPGSLERLVMQDWGMPVQRCSGGLGRMLTRVDAERPRLELDARAQRSLGEGRWMVEVVVRNHGEAAIETPGPPPAIALGGARLVALAAATEDGVFQVATPRSALAGLEGHGQRRLRIVLEVSGSDAPMLSLSGPRWRTAYCTLGLGTLQPK